MKTFVYMVMTEDGDELDEFLSIKDARIFAKTWSKESNDKCYICVMGCEYYENGKEVDCF